MLNREPSPRDRYDILLRASENLLTKVDDHEMRITKIENYSPINSRKAQNIKRHATRHITKLLGGHGTTQYKEHYRSYISRLWHDYWNTFGVTTYQDTPISMYDAALDWIENWRPLQVTKLDEKGA